MNQLYLLQKWVIDGIKTMKINCEDLIFDFIVVSTIDVEPRDLGLIEDDNEYSQHNCQFRYLFHQKCFSLISSTIIMLKIHSAQGYLNQASLTSTWSGLYYRQGSEMCGSNQSFKCLLHSACFGNESPPFLLKCQHSESPLTSTLEVIEL